MIYDGCSAFGVSLVGEPKSPINISANDVTTISTWSAIQILSDVFIMLFLSFLQKYISNQAEILTKKAPPK